MFSDPETETGEVPGNSGARRGAAAFPRGENRSLEGHTPRRHGLPGTLYDSPGGSSGQRVKSPFSFSSLQGGSFRTGSFIRILRGVGRSAARLSWGTASGGASPRVASSAKKTVKNRVKQDSRPRRPGRTHGTRPPPRPDGITQGWSSHQLPRVRGSGFRAGKGQATKGVV